VWEEVQRPMFKNRPPKAAKGHSGLEKRPLVSSDYTNDTRQRIMMRRLRWW